MKDAALEVGTIRKSLGEYDDLETRSTFENSEVVKLHIVNFTLYRDSVRRGTIRSELSVSQTASAAIRGFAPQDQVPRPFLCFEL